MRGMPFERQSRGRGENLTAELSASRKDTLLRLLRYVLQNYKFSLLTVAVCIIITSITTTISTLFTRTLIDDYIVPLTQMDNPQYASLAQILFKLGVILFIGVACSYTYNRIMIYVTQGTMLRLRNDMFSHMQSLLKHAGINTGWTTNSFTASRTAASLSPSLSRRPT